jgi:hypothetical protein
MKTRKWVVIEITMGFENVPVGLTKYVPTFLIVDGRKVKRSMDECVRMSEVDKFPKGKEFVTILSIMS